VWSSFDVRGYPQCQRTGIHTVTVPGAVAGWDALGLDSVTLPFSELLNPAITYAETEFPLTEVVARVGPLRQSDCWRMVPPHERTWPMVARRKRESCSKIKDWPLPCGESQIPVAMVSIVA
jgi:hypothetical protein